MFYTIAKVNNKEMLSGLFGGDTSAIIFEEDKIFETQEDASNYIKTVLNEKLIKKVDNRYNNATDIIKEKWIKELKEDENNCLIAERYIIIPIQEIVDLSGRPSFLSEDNINK